MHDERGRRVPAEIERGLSRQDPVAVVIAVVPARRRRSRARR
ncbi:hypothetical protein AB0C29_34085 [Actinoplanes sp. NPDC048791]